MASQESIFNFSQQNICIKQIKYNKSEMKWTTGFWVIILISNEIIIVRIFNSISRNIYSKYLLYEFNDLSGRIARESYYVCNVLRLLLFVLYYIHG